MVTRLDKQVAPGTVVGGRYRVERLLGEGGFASVYLARHVELETPVAIKRMHTEHLTRDDLQNRFRIEAKTAARLESRHTVRVRDFGFDDDGTPFMVMDLVRGPTLETLLEAHGPYDEDTVAATALGVLAALAEAASQGVIHRDIKPANIFLDQLRAQRIVIAKVSDFGIAKLIHADPQSATRTADGIMCTPQYAAPEMLRREAAPASDIYALGHVMVELLDGVAPYAGDNAIVSAAQHLNDAPVPLGERSSRSLLAPVLERALSKSLESRYRSAVEMRDAIHAVYATAGRAVSAELPHDALGADTGAAPEKPLPTTKLDSAAHTPQVVEAPEPPVPDEAPELVTEGPGPVGSDAPQRTSAAGMETALIPADDADTEPMVSAPVRPADVGLRPLDDPGTRRLLLAAAAAALVVIVWVALAVLGGDGEDPGGRATNGGETESAETPVVPPFESDPAVAGTSEGFEGDVPTLATGPAVAAGEGSASGDLAATEGTSESDEQAPSEQPNDRQPSEHRQLPDADTPSAGGRDAIRTADRSDDGEGRPTERRRVDEDDRSAEPTRAADREERSRSHQTADDDNARPQREPTDGARTSSPPTDDNARPSGEPADNERNSGERVADEPGPDRGSDAEDDAPEGSDRPSLRVPSPLFGQ